MAKIDPEFGDVLRVNFSWPWRGPIAESLRLMYLTDTYAIVIAAYDDTTKDGIGRSWFEHLFTVQTYNKDAFELDPEWEASRGA